MLPCVYGALCVLWSPLTVHGLPELADVARGEGGAAAQASSAKAAMKDGLIGED